MKGLACVTGRVLDDRVVSAARRRRRSYDPRLRMQVHQDGGAGYLRAMLFTLCVGVKSPCSRAEWLRRSEAVNLLLRRVQV